MSQYQEFKDVFEKRNVDTLPKHWSYDYTIDLVEGVQPPFGPSIICYKKNLQHFVNTLMRTLKKGSFNIQSFQQVPLSSLLRKKIILCKYVLIIMDLINSPSTISYFCLWYQGCWISLIMPRSTPRLIYVEHITWCAFKKVMNGRWCLKHIIVILNILWCHLALIMRLMFSNIWWTMFFVSTWMILWVAISMISSFSQRTWRTMNAMYI